MRCKFIIFLLVSLLFTSCMRGELAVSSTKDSKESSTENEISTSKEDLSTETASEETDTSSEDSATILAETTSKSLEEESGHDKSSEEETSNSIEETTTLAEDYPTAGEGTALGEEATVQTSGENIESTSKAGETVADTNNSDEEITDKPYIDKVYIRGVKREDLANVLVIDDKNIFLHDKNKGRLKKFMSFNFKPIAVNRVYPILLASNKDTVFLYDLRTGTRVEIFVWKDIKLLNAMWSKDGRTLAFTIYYKEYDKYVVYTYDLETASLRAISMGKASGYVFSNDGKKLIITEKNLKKSTAKYEFKLKKCEIGKDIRTIYKLDSSSGSIYTINDYGMEDDDKAYVILRVYDGEEDLSNSYIYDFADGEMETIISFSDIYESYMNRYSVDTDIKAVYSQLGKWYFPMVEFCESDDSIYISDGLNYFYYPHKMVSGEGEIGKYKSINTVLWLDDYFGESN